MSIRRPITTLALVLVIAGLLLPASPAAAAPLTYIVNSTADDIDAGGCETSPNDCTLREAITDANGVTNAAQKIQFALGAGVPTINVGSALPNITDKININGNTGGATRVEITGPPGPDGLLGLHVSGVGASGTIIRRLIINGFSGNGVRFFEADNVTFSGNWIGLDETGVYTDGGGTNTALAVSSSSGATIGGLTAGTRNVLAGFPIGIDLASPGSDGNNHVLGNYIGAHADGTNVVAVTGIGINMAGELGNTVEANTVVGVDGPAIRLSFGSDDNMLIENRLGLYPDGTEVTNHQGIVAENDSLSNAFIRNLITSGDSGLGIDLGGDGVTPNDNADADTGPNGLQNFPVLTRADNLAAGTTRINGRLRSAPSTTYSVDLYSNAWCHPSGFGEGEEYLHTVAFTTDATGRATFSIDIPALPVGNAVTGTARDLATGDTSEFSACITVIP